MNTRFFRFIMAASVPVLVAFTAHADPAKIKVEGASEIQLEKARTALEKAAYGVDPAVLPESSDQCEAYKPPAKLRLWKQMPVTDHCQTLARAPWSTSLRGPVTPAVPENGIIADTGSSIIFLCKNGVAIADYDFSMGRNGVNKRVAGDKKTPIGRYPLERPRTSNEFKLFIPIGFPTPEQILQGYSGSDIGIHGPSRKFRCAGFLNVMVDWTQGCLAVSSDVFVKEIARFIEMNNVTSITIL